MHDVPFPFQRVAQDGRPLVYASLGTLQIDRRDLFHAIAEALSTLDVQVVIAHGGSLTPEEERSLPGNPIVQALVPQEESLKRASLCVTHGGLNTVLDAVAAAVPLVVMPIAFEQPATGARVAYREAGIVVRADRALPGTSGALSKRSCTSHGSRRPRGKSRLNWARPAGPCGPLT